VPVIVTDTMTKPSTLSTLDEALDGRISELLRTRRADGASASQIRDEIRDELHVTVSERTVNRWLALMAADAEEAAS
jgi:hypothetical protein